MDSETWFCGGPLGETGPPSSYLVGDGSLCFSFGEDGFLGPCGMCSCRGCLLLCLPRKPGKNIEVADKGRPMDDKASYLRVYCFFDARVSLLKALVLEPPAESH